MQFLKRTLYLTLFVVSLGSFGQNLIPNGDFESGPGFTSPAWIYKIIPPSCSPFASGGGPTSWTSIHFTPDRLIEGQIPCSWDNDTAACGSAYVDFGPGEAAQATLNAPLQHDSAYKLSCFLSLNTFRGLSDVPISLYFKFPGMPDSLFTPLVSDTAWYHYEMIFVASGNSSTIQVWGTGDPNSVYSSVNIDSLSLVKIYATSVKSTSASKDHLVYPNPASDRIHFGNLNEKNMITLYDPLGKIILQYFNVGENSIPIPPGLSGIYYLEIQDGSTKSHQQLLINAAFTD